MGYITDCGQVVGSYLAEVGHQQCVASYIKGAAFLCIEWINTIRVVNMEGRR